MKNIPEKIYLQIGEDCEAENFNSLNREYVTWSSHRIDANDIEYSLQPSPPMRLREVIETRDEQAERWAEAIHLCDIDWNNEQEKNDYLINHPDGLLGIFQRTKDDFKSGFDYAIEKLKSISEPLPASSLNWVRASEVNPVIDEEMEGNPRSAIHCRCRGGKYVAYFWGGKWLTKLKINSENLSPIPKSWEKDWEWLDESNSTAPTSPDWKQYCNWFDENGGGLKAEIFADGFENGFNAAQSKAPTSSDEGYKEKFLSMVATAAGWKEKCLYMEKRCETAEKDSNTLAEMVSEAWGVVVKMKKCTKPHCDCVFEAEKKAGGPVKDYPCLADHSDLSQLKSLPVQDENKK